jgi:hypothetical protein
MERNRRRLGFNTEEHRLADFTSLDDLIEHARQEGATHVLQIDDETHLYFQRRDGRYEKSEVWQKDGYWHTQGPGSRAVVRRPPEGAKSIEGVARRGRIATEAGGTRGGPARRYYVVDQVQGGHWVQVGHFATKQSAEHFRAGLHGKTRIVHTFPSGHDHPPTGARANERVNEAPTRSAHHPLTRARKR